MRNDGIDKLDACTVRTDTPKRVGLSKEAPRFIHIVAATTVSKIQECLQFGRRFTVTTRTRECKNSKVTHISLFLNTYID